MCNARTQQKRLKQILQYTKETLQEDDPQAALKFLLTKDVPATSKEQTQITLEDTIRICHEFNINCHNYEKVAQWMHLPYKWNEVNNLMHSMQKNSPVGDPEPIDGLDGHQYSFVKYLTFYLSKRGCVNGEKIDIKLSCDG
jgi:hypothetical protein